MLVTSVVDPDPNWIRFQQLFGFGSNLDPVPIWIRFRQLCISGPTELK